MKTFAKTPVLLSIFLFGCGGGGGGDGLVDNGTLVTSSFTGNTISDQNKPMHAINNISTFKVKYENLEPEFRNVTLPLLRKVMPLEPSLEDIVATASHSGSRVDSGYPTDYHTGFNFDDADKSSCWRPQGLTGTSDAYPLTESTSTGRKLILVGWHDEKCVTDKEWSDSDRRGLQLTFVDVSDMNKIKYVKVLLIIPELDESKTIANFKAATIHGGGISWVGNYIYVVDTHGGFRVFDINSIMIADTTSTGSHGKIGVHDGKAFAYGFKYIIPQVDKYKYTKPTENAKRPESIIFSWISLDQSTSPSSFITGEYSDSITELDGRVFRWRLDANTNKLEVNASNDANSYQAFYMAQRSVQGGFSRTINNEPTYWFTGKLWANAGGPYYLFKKTEKSSSTMFNWSFAHTAQNLHYSKSSDNLWSLIEQDPKTVFSVKLKDLK